MMAKKRTPSKHRKPTSYALNARGDSNREFLVGLLIFILFGLSAAAALTGGGKAAVTAIFNPGTTPPPAAHHETVTLTLAQSKGVNWTPFEKWRTKESYNWAGIESDVTDMQNAGISWVRFSLSGDTAVDDKIVTLLSEHDIRILAVIQANPPKVKGNFIQRLFYRDGVKKLAARYPQKIQYYEVGDEPNTASGWTIDPTDGSNESQFDQAVKDYIDHMKETVAAIKSGNGNAVVFLGGLSDTSANRWLDSFMKQNGYSYIDGVSFHVLAANPVELGQKVHALKVELAKVSEFAVKPIWITDFGFTTDPKDTTPAHVSDEKTKADYVLQSYAAIRGEGLYGPIFWKKLSENESNKTGFGLIMKDSSNLQTTYLPAYDTLKSF